MLVEEMCDIVEWLEMPYAPWRLGVGVALNVAAKAVVAVAVDLRFPFPPAGEKRMLGAEEV